MEYRNTGNKLNDFLGGGKLPHNEQMESLGGRKLRKKGDMKQKEKDGGRDKEKKGIRGRK